MTDIAQILRDHQVWLAHPQLGKQAKLRMLDCTGFDFSPYNLQSSNINYCNLTNCKFPTNYTKGICVRNTGTNVSFIGTDITDTTVAWSDIDTLVGAIWHGVTITDVEKPIEFDGLCIIWTNAFVQIGCAQETKEKWSEIFSSEANMRTELIKYPDMEFSRISEWWTKWQNHVVK